MRDLLIAFAAWFDRFFTHDNEEERPWFGFEG